MHGSAGAPMFVFDMANNHMGSVEHGLRIVREVREAVDGLPFTFAFKLQYRELDSFIHPDFKGRDDVPYVKRFSETRLSDDEKLALRNGFAEAGFVSVCTPFDEASVDLIEEHGFDVIKIASCSVTDWPLLERVVQADKPLIVSTGGASLEDLDRVVSFLTHRGKDLTLMHCVAEYPTETRDLQLNQIAFLRERYAGVAVGFSTHEHPGDLLPVTMAVAQGACVLERHVGVATDEWKLNAYSSTPEQVRAWVTAAQVAAEACGVLGRRYEPSEAETASLMSLRRGVFAGEDVATGAKVAPVFFAIPTVEGQLTANDMSKYRDYYARKPIAARGALMQDAVRSVDRREKANAIVDRLKAFLAEKGMDIPGHLYLEISHHYGIDRFDEYGAVIVTFVNREYCKKLIVMLPGQKHPEQYHEIKEETFQVLHGEMDLALDGEERTYGVGEIVTVERGVKHAFGAPDGCIIEEVSSMHIKEDSYYTDPAISQNPDRKTVVSHWLE